MAYKFVKEKLKIPKSLDRRRKLSDEQIEQIRRLYGTVSQRKLAKRFGVSKRTIVFYGCPEKLEHNKQLRKLRGGEKQYYSKDKHKGYMKKYRQYKQSLNLQGKLERSSDES